LLEAFTLLRSKQPELHLHIAGSGSGQEAETLRQRMKIMGANLTMHGMLGQEKLAELMGNCAITVLPSLYEGVPLVLAEAAACGCKIVATELPGVKEHLAPVFGKNLHLIPLPKMIGIDKPTQNDLPQFVQNIAIALNEALVNHQTAASDLSSLTWQNVFQKIEHVWRQQLIDKIA